jgi:hypothetical protein
MLINVTNYRELKAIFDEDQRVEASFRRLKAMGLDTTPASVWRWLPYNARGEVLQKRFEAHGMRDEGTGSTLPTTCAMR